MNATEYKKYHESFMENNHGSSLSHTFMCIFYTVQCSVKTSIMQQNQSDLKQYVYEYVLIILPMILVHTVASNVIGILTLIDSLYVVLQLSRVLSKPQLRKVFLSKNIFSNKQILSITYLRGLTYLITVFSILAVDFKQFPRFLAKTEKFGYSFMDTGVGLFIFMSGLVHRDISKNLTSINSALKRNLKFITVLVILGVARFVSVKHLDYQEHVTEYGVHWNFFFTLAVCKFLSTITLFFFVTPLTLSIVTIILHELLLYNGLQEWVFGNTPRITLVNANREGIASSLGYVSMYFFAVYIKQELNNQSIQRYELFIKLSCCSLLLGFLSYVMNIFIPTARILANTSYCIYLAFILVVILSFLYVLEVLSMDEEINFNFKIPLILSNINKNGLVYFLIGNISTGVINMLIQTLLMPGAVTFMILNIYMIFTLLITVYLNKKGLSI